MSIRSLLTAACLAFAACGPVARAPASPAAALPPVPDDGIARDVHRLPAAGGAIVTRSWRARDVARKGAVVILCEQGRRGDDRRAFAEGLARAGYAVYGPDLRGYAWDTGAARDFDAVVDDALAVIDGVRAAEGAAPLFVIGHGLGGTVALRASQRHTALAGVVLAAPVVGVHEPLWRLSAYTFNPFPLQPSRLPRIGAGVDAVWSHRGDRVAPVLIVHGEVDAIAPPAESRDLAAELASEDRTVVVLPGVDHEVLDGDADGASEVRAWLDVRVEGPQRTAAIPRGPLPGDRPHMAVGLRLLGGYLRSPDADYEKAYDVRLRLSYGAPLGWFGVVSCQGRRCMASPLGVVWRVGEGGELAFALGAGLDGLGTNLDLATGATAALDLPLGRWVAMTTTVDAGWRWLDGDERSLDVRAQAGVRIGPSRRLGRTARGASGFLLSALYQRRFGDDFVGLGIGYDLAGSR